MTETRRTANANAHENKNAKANTLVPNSKLSKNFVMSPVYDGNQIFLKSFISVCNTAQSRIVNNQHALIFLLIKEFETSHHERTSEISSKPTLETQETFLS